ncbi:MAG: TIGR03118 family protein [Proteobacteria bacterium]|nr:TIGR03118 family protein [Pseudomonadota bacterium]
MQVTRPTGIALAIGALLALLATPAVAVSFDVTNLVTNDQGAHAAQITDAGLVNAWGIAYAPGGPFWVSANGSGTSPIYSVNGATQQTVKQGLTVTIPGEGSVTGQAYNGNASAFNGDLFLFGSEDGTISGWRSGTTAEVLVTASAANNYKGVAVGSTGGNSYLYAANFRAGTIDIVKGTSGAPGLTGNFADPNLPTGYAPFNVQNLGGSVYVSYAKPDAGGNDEIDGPGFGYVDHYDLQGNFLGRVGSGGALNAPWGMAIAPSSFGAWAGKLLVGNFGDGRINVFDQGSGTFLGQVAGANGQALSIDGLWSITPGNGGLAGSADLLYFSAGPEAESNGLFGVLQVAAVPEPGTLVLMAGGLGLIGALARRRQGQGQA